MTTKKPATKKTTTRKTTTRKRATTKSRKTKNKEIDFDTAKEIVTTVLESREEFLGINWNNFRKINDLYQTTMEKMSLDALITLLEHPDVKNVYFHPSVAPPGSGVDGIALRYRVYFEFN